MRKISAYWPDYFIRFQNLISRSQKNFQHNSSKNQPRVPPFQYDVSFLQILWDIWKQNCKKGNNTNYIWLFVDAKVYAYASASAIIFRKGWYWTTQISFNCSKLTIEKPEQCVKTVQSYQQGTRTTSSFWTVK